MSSIELRTVRDESKPSAASSTPSEPSRVVSRTLPTTKHRIALVVVLIMCVTVVTMTRFPDVMQHNSHTQGKIVAKMDEMVTIPLQPKQEVVYGEHHFYMLPKSPFQKAVGVLVVLHPCRRSGLDFFHLPEDRIVAKDALEKGLAVLSLTSKDRVSGCFTSEDSPIVSQIVDQWIILHNLQDVPRYGLGISSGASFLFFVYRGLRLDSMVVYNTPQGFLPKDMDDHALIPTAFVTMTMDKRLNKRIRNYHKELFLSQVPTQLFQVSPRPFTKTICLSRLPEMLPKDCDRIFDALRADFSHLIDQNGFVLEDVASEDWTKLTNALDLDSWSDQLHFQTIQTTAGHSWPYAALEQEFSTCRARHGMSSEHHSTILDFLMTAPERMTSDVLVVDVQEGG